jgi:hypothetical protein
MKPKIAFKIENDRGVGEELRRAGDLLPHCALEIGIGDVADPDHHDGEECALHKISCHTRVSAARLDEGILTARLAAIPGQRNGSVCVNKNTGLRA